MTSLRYATANSSQCAQLVDVLSLSFGIARDDSQMWAERVGADNVRVLCDGDDVVAGLYAIPMGQYFGGRRVEMHGIAGVGVPPPQRGRGLATELMRRCVREMHRRGVALSVLYPASVPLYRRAGYEIAGGSWRISLNGKSFHSYERELEVRPFDSGDERQVRRVYAAAASARQGWLDRGAYVWERTRRQEEGAETRGHVLVSGKQVEGYVFYRQRRAPMGFDLAISDMAATTPRAMRGLWTFLADHRSLTREVRWFGGVDEPLLQLSRDHSYKIALHHHWMLRICDVAAALEQRGYPRGVEAELHLDVCDDVVRKAGGRFRLRIADGRAEVRRGGRGTLRLDVRTLAALYSGHMGAHALSLLGRIEAKPRTIAMAASAFGLAPPSRPDMF